MAARIEGKEIYQTLVAAVVSSNAIGKDTYVITPEKGEPLGFSYTSSNLAHWIAKVEAEVQNEVSQSNSFPQKPWSFIVLQ